MGINLNQSLKGHAIAFLPSRDSDDARNSDGGQEVKRRMDEMEESPYCTGLDIIIRERYQKSTGSTPFKALGTPKENNTIAINLHPAKTVQ